MLPTPTKSLLSILLLSSILLLGVATGPSPIKAMKQKLTRLRFYFHEGPQGRNTTSVLVTTPLNSSSTLFGLIKVMDDPLTEGPDLGSKPVGRAQGMYAFASLDEIGLLQAMNLYFTAGKYNGSVLTVLGRNMERQPLREMPVVGGSGLFRFATGYALAKTHIFDITTGFTTVEYNVVVMHY